MHLFVPKRDEMLSIISGLAAEHLPENPKILDVGSSSGDVTAGILRFRPHAQAYLVDISDEMIRLSQERFRENQRIHITKHNLNEDFRDAVPERGFNAVVSCLALHHTAFDRRVGLYQCIHEVLKPGGIFINGDVFKSESSSIDLWEMNTWIAEIARQMRELEEIEKPFNEVRTMTLELLKKNGDKPGTIWEMQRDMRQAGFISVDCLWKYQIYAILAAVK